MCCSLYKFNRDKNKFLGHPPLPLLACYVLLNYGFTGKQRTLIYIGIPLFHHNFLHNLLHSFVLSVEIYRGWREKFVL